MLEQSAVLVRTYSVFNPFAQLVASALAHVQRSSEGAVRGGSCATGREVKLRGDDVDLNHLLAPCIYEHAHPSHAPSHMSDAELAKYKLLMEEDFRKHQLKPGDEGYEYDKQVRTVDAARRPGLTAEAGGVRARHRRQRLGRKRRRELRAVFGKGKATQLAALQPLTP